MYNILQAIKYLIHQTVTLTPKLHCYLKVDVQWSQKARLLNYKCRCTATMRRQGHITQYKTNMAELFWCFSPESQLLCYLPRCNSLWFFARTWTTARLSPAPPAARHRATGSVHAATGARVPASCAALGPGPTDPSPQDQELHVRPVGARMTANLNNMVTGV